jgi:hypothetical protein
MEGSTWFHAPVAISPGKETQVPVAWETVGPRADHVYHSFLTCVLGVGYKKLTSVEIPVKILSVSDVACINLRL